MRGVSSKECVDFVVIKSIPPNGGAVIDYHLTIDMAKELVIVDGEVVEVG